MPPKAKCVDCGYLQILNKGALWHQLKKDDSTPIDTAEGSEVSIGNREEIKYRNFRGVTSLICFRKIDFYPSLDKPVLEKELQRTIYTSCIDSRRCPYFSSYVPGLSPSEHLIFEEQNRQNKHRRMRIAKWILILVVTALICFALGAVLRPMLEKILFSIQ